MAMRRAPLNLDAGSGPRPDRTLRVGWLVEPGFGPIASDVAATVEVAAQALRNLGCIVEAVRIPALQELNSLEIYSRLHVLEIEPYFKQYTAGRDRRFSRSWRVS